LNGSFAIAPIIGAETPAYLLPVGHSPAYRLKSLCFMSDLTATILRTSVSVLAAAVRGNPDGIVQQQIRTMGLQQWLAFVVLWSVETIYADVSDFIAPARTIHLRSVAVELAVPTPIYLF
jgi:hypothetical protein